ncbi:MAG: hypothetical protein AB4368_13265 [Xenococcaceae cyanobacterium]
MSKIVKALLTTGIIFGLQPAIAVPIKPEIVEQKIVQNPNIMMELVNNWGFELAECGEDVAIVKHDRTGEKACVTPNEELKAGNFIYDSANNKIYPETIESTIPNNTNSLPEKVEETGIIFNFANAYDYNVCLDNILLAYENRQTELEQSTKNECANNILNTYGDRLSQATALDLITSADNYATQVLDVQLYPTYGLRRRVAMHFGYIYDIDRNNEDILRYTSPEG